MPANSHFPAKTIGLFDSGVGGLSVLRQLGQITHFLGQPIRFLYLGDTARCPYGNRRAEEVVGFAKQIIAWLIRQGSDIIVMACNTSAALAGKIVKEEFSIPIYDLINPTADLVAKEHGNVGIMATTATVASQAFSKAIKMRNEDVQVREIACPQLVPLIESGNLDSPETRQVLASYLADVASEDIEAIVLGCTHYPFLSETMKCMISHEVCLIDPARELARTLVPHKPFLSVQSKSENIWQSSQFFVTGDAQTFQRHAAVCIGSELGSVSQIRLEDLDVYDPTAVVPAVSILGQNLS